MGTKDLKEREMESWNQKGFSRLLALSVAKFRNYEYRFKDPQPAFDAH